MDCSSGVITGAHQREFVGQFGVLREDFRDLDIRIVCFYRLERTADFRRGIWFHVPGVQLAGGSQIENEDDGFLIIAFGYSPKGLERGKLRKRQSNGAQRADLHEIAARNSVTGGDRPFATY